MSVFSKGDILEASGSKAIQIIKTRGLKAYEGYEEDGNDFSITPFARNAKELKDRLKVLGYSEKTFRLFLQAILSYESEPLTSTGDEHLDKFRAKRRNETEELVEAYISGKELSEDNLIKLSDILEYDACFALYYALKDIENTANVTLDISEFAYEGWYDDSMLELNEVVEDIQRSSTPPIILTEGVFDRKVLKESIELLYPHLANYIKFLDTD